MKASSVVGRPEDCRIRRLEEGKSYPERGCMRCGTGGIAGGCPYENQERRTDMSNEGIDYRTLGYSPSAAEKELADDEVYERARSFLNRPEMGGAASLLQSGVPLKVFDLPLQRILHRQIGQAMHEMKVAATEKHTLMVRLATQERNLATAREELGAVLDAWPAEKVVAA